MSRLRQIAALGVILLLAGGPSIAAACDAMCGEAVAIATGTPAATPPSGHHHSAGVHQRAAGHRVAAGQRLPGELLFTNRVILQPLVELELYGTSDPERGIGAGLSSAEAGLRLRYEIRRELAPYIGAQWTRKFFGTADRAAAAGEPAGAVRLAAGVRVWF